MEKKESRSTDLKIGWLAVVFTAFTATAQKEEHLILEE